MKEKRLIIVPIILITLFLCLFWRLYIKPVDIELTLIKIVEETRPVISECPVYWTCLQEHKYGSLYFKKEQAGKLG